MKGWIYSNIVFPIFKEYVKPVEPVNVHSETFILDRVVNLSKDQGTLMAGAKAAVAIDVTEYLLEKKYIKVENVLEVINGVTVHRLRASIIVYKND